MTSGPNFLHQLLAGDTLRSEIPFIELAVAVKHRRRAGRDDRLRRGVMLWATYDPLGFDLYEMVPEFLANLVAIGLFNRYGRSLSRQMLNDFDAVELDIQK